jgi:hypothetical protein
VAIVKVLLSLAVIYGLLRRGNWDPVNCSSSRLPTFALQIGNKETINLFRGAPEVALTEREQVPFFEEMDKQYQLQTFLVIKNCTPLNYVFFDVNSWLMSD